MTTSAPQSAATSNAVHGRFVWHDLMTTDPDGARRFYPQIMGWGTQLWEQSTPPYTMWTVDNQSVGGMMPLPADAGAPPHWLTYIETPDVDATVARATQLGAKTFVPPTDIPTVGRFAVLSDPQGAGFSVFSPIAQSPAHEGQPRVGDASWHELLTTDFESAFAFYAELFDWRKTEAMDMGDAGTYQMFGQGSGPSVGGMYNIKPGMQAQPNWLPYFSVASADRAAELTKQLGGTVVHGPAEVPGGGRIAMCLDPQGCPFAVHSLAS